MTAHRLQVTPITKRTWSLFERLLGPTGVAGGCWCAYFTTTAHHFNTSAPTHRQSHSRQRLGDGLPFGLVAHQGDDPLAWVAVSPRACNPRLERSVVARTDTGRDLNTTWSVTCLYTRPNVRGQGLSRMLLDAAVLHARQHGAHAVEGYPTDTTIGPVSPDEPYHGRLATFLTAGFKLIARPGKRRALVGLSVDPVIEHGSRKALT